MLGEYGVPDNDSRWWVTLENMLIYLKENGVSGTYWSAGPRWGNYTLSVQPTDNYTVDRPQMSVLEKYTTGSSSGIVEDVLNNLDNDLRVSCIGNEVVVRSDTPREMSVWNLSGALVHKVSVAPDSPAYFTLEKGFYLVDKVKIVVK